MSEFQHTIYSKKAALKIIFKKGYLGFETASVLEGTENDKNPKYDWAKSTYVSFNVPEIGSILHHLKAVSWAGALEQIQKTEIPPFKFYHEKNGVVKSGLFGTYSRPNVPGVCATYQVETSGVKHSLLLNKNEMEVISALLTSAIPEMCPVFSGQPTN